MKTTTEIPRKCSYCKEPLLNEWQIKYCSSTCRGKRTYEHRKTGESNWVTLRFKILARDNFRCVFCGRTPVEDGVRLHVDHWNPLINNGNNDMSNLLTSCEECNLGKSDAVLPDSLKPMVEISEEKRR